ncbi:hypothetical protein F4678DRAFT_402280 [Xylaria arbuscula]|nr:hypothetical protein F4678DRAFT_402280 [Xylaria arbuscula]
MTTDVQRQDTSSRGGQLAAPKRKRADTSNSTEPITANNKRQRLTSRLCPSSSDDAKVLSTVDARYEVQLQSVISSSKIRQRVTAILRHLTAPTNPSSTDDPMSNAATSRTKISVLRSKASEAGKLISIAEIAKREIETEKEESASDGETGQGGGKGRWFQYIALGEELQHKDRDEANTVIEETVLDGPDNARDPDEDDEFEVMKTPFERAIEGQPLARGVAIISLFLSRSPVEELKRRYGEQTNAPPK